MPPHEHVLVYPRSLLDALGAFHGLRTEAAPYVDAILRPESLRWMLREDAERDPAFKQVIPYIVLAHGRDLFAYTRGKQAGEQRLVAQRSVGVGGHIAQEDHDLFTEFGRDLYDAAMHREVREEIVLEAPYAERLLGVINDDSTEVGQVHFGIAHVWDLGAPHARKREAQITQAGFVSIESLLLDRANLETWSQFCVDALARQWGVAC